MRKKDRKHYWPPTFKKFYIYSFILFFTFTNILIFIENATFINFFYGNLLVLGFHALIIGMFMCGSNLDIILFSEYLKYRSSKMKISYDRIRRLIVFKKRKLGIDIDVILIILDDGNEFEIMVKNIDECYEDLKSRCKNLENKTVVEYKENEIYTKIGDVTFEIISIVKTPMMNDFRKMFLIEFTEGKFTMLFSEYFKIQDTHMPSHWTNEKVKKSMRKSYKYNTSIGKIEVWCPRDYCDNHDFFFAIASGQIDEAYKIYKETKKKYESDKMFSNLNNNTSFIQ